MIQNETNSKKILVVDDDAPVAETIASILSDEGFSLKTAGDGILAKNLLELEHFDLVLSDMAPNLSGVGVADAARMAFLAEIALDFAVAHLKPEGALLIKCFNGSGYSQIVESFKKVFKSVSSRKPKASRARSSEIFLLGRNLKPPK